MSAGATTVEERSDTGGISVRANAIEAVDGLIKQIGDTIMSDQRTQLLGKVEQIADELQSDADLAIALAVEGIACHWEEVRTTCSWMSRTPHHGAQALGNRGVFVAAVEVAMDERGEWLFDIDDLRGKLGLSFDE